MDPGITMDFQAALPAPGGGSDESAEPRAMDTEDGPDAPGRRGDGGRPEELSRTGPQPGSGSGPEGPGPAAAPALAGGAGGRTEPCRGSGRAMGAEAVPEAPQGSARWEPGAGSAPRGTARPRTPSSAEPAGMELDETPEPRARRAPSAEWTEDVEDEPSEIQGLLAQLETLDPKLRDCPSTPEQGSPSPSGAGARRGRGQCPGRCRPCPLHVATGRGLAMRPCCPRHSACDRPCHGLLFAEADREDLLNLLCYEGGLPEAGAETPLAHSDVLAGTNLEIMQAQEEPATVEKPEGLGRPESSEEEPSGSWCYREGLCEDNSACEGAREGSPEPAWAALPSALVPGTEQPPQGAVTVSALCCGGSSGARTCPLALIPPGVWDGGKEEPGTTFLRSCWALRCEIAQTRPSVPALALNAYLHGWLIHVYPGAEAGGSEHPLWSWDPGPSSLLPQDPAPPCPTLESYAISPIPRALAPRPTVPLLQGQAESPRSQPQPHLLSHCFAEQGIRIILSSLQRR